MYHDATTNTGWMGCNFACNVSNLDVHVAVGISNTRKSEHFQEVPRNLQRLNLRVIQSVQVRQRQPSQPGRGRGTAQSCSPADGCALHGRFAT